MTSKWSLSAQGCDVGLRTVARTRARGILLGAAALALLASGCGSRRDQFIDGRTLDTCNQSWPACGAVAGCLLGPQTYAEGRFPGDGKFIVQIAEPSTVTLSVFVDDVGAAGIETAFKFWEGACTSNTRISIDGKDYVSESENIGFVSRSVDLTSVGDHLIEYRSDSQSTYVIKVDVVPKRLQNGGT